MSSEATGRPLSSDDFEINFSEFKVLLEHDKKHPLRDFSKADKRDKKMVGR